MIRESRSQQRLISARRKARRSRTPNEDADDEDKHATDDDRHETPA
jgi:hypothetical protein